MLLGVVSLIVTDTLLPAFSCPPERKLTLMALLASEPLMIDWDVEPTLSRLVLVVMAVTFGGNSM